MRNNKKNNKNNNKRKISFFYLLIKRFFDIIVSIIGLILTIPIYLIVKLCYMITGDFSSIIYSHERIGKNGKLFKLYKFRSMVKDADIILKDLLKNDKELAKEWKRNHKLENDPRITKIGNIIRKLSLDECPQFLNILIGDMSLVGPRPLVKGELDEHEGNHEIYESVKPGMTGWWAVNGRSCTDYDQRLELEYYYCNNCSIWLDIKCIFKTIGVVLCRKGAK